LTYKNMIDQAMALEFVGLWDFRKAEMFEFHVKTHPEKLNKKLLQRFSKENTKLLWSISQKPSKLDTIATQRRIQGSVVEFTNGLFLDLETFSPKLISRRFGRGIPYSVYVIEGGELKEHRSANPTLDICVYLIKDVTPARTTYRSVLMSERFAKSFVMKLFYMNGQGLNFVKPFSQANAYTRRTHILAHEVDWEGFKLAIDK